MFIGAITTENTNTKHARDTESTDKTKNEAKVFPEIF